MCLFCLLCHWDGGSEQRELEKSNVEYILGSGEPVEEGMKNEKKRQVSEEMKQWHKGVQAGQAASESMDKRSTSLV